MFFKKLFQNLKSVSIFFLNDFVKDWKMMLLLFVPIFLFLVYIDSSFYTKIGFLQFRSVDEYAFHGSLLIMYEGLANFQLKNIFNFGFYNYGFIFFFINLLCTLPFIFFHNSGMMIIVPRLVTSFFSVIMLVYFYKFCRIYLSNIASSFLVFASLLTPAFLVNATWFHPDFMMAAFLMMAVYFLARDEFTYSYWFPISVCFFSLAVSTKYQAIIFLPIFILYIFKHEISRLDFVSFKKNLCIFIKFILFVVGFFIVSNPQIVHPKGFALFKVSFLSGMQSNADNHNYGFDVGLVDKLRDIVAGYYINYVFFFLLLAISFYLAFLYFREKKKNIFSILALTFLVTFGYLFIFVNSFWNHYYIPVMYLGFLVIIPFLKKINVEWKQAGLLGIILVGQLFFNGNNIIKHFTEQHDYSPNDYSLAEHKEISDFIIDNLNGRVNKGSHILISLNTGFDYEKLGLDYDNVVILWPPLEPAYIDVNYYIENYKRIYPKSDENELAVQRKKFRQIDFVILKKNEAFIDTNQIDKKNNKDAWLASAVFFNRLKNGLEVGYKLYSENKYVYIFKKI